MRALTVGLTPQMLETSSLALRLRWPDTQPIVVTDLPKALRLIEDRDFDLVLVSLDLPDGAALSFIRGLRTMSDIPLISFTETNDDEMIRVRALELGSDEVITPGCSLIEQLTRIGAVLRRARPGSADSPSAPVQIDSLFINPTSYEVYLDGQSLHLTPTEFRMLYTFARHKGVVLTHSALQRAIWDEDEAPGAEVVKKYVQRLRRKLGDNPKAPRWIVSIPGVGYRFVVRIPARTGDLASSA